MAQQRTTELAKEYLTLCRRYGVRETRPELDRIEVAMNRRRFKIKHLRSRITEIEEQLRWLQNELEGYDKGLALILREAIDELREGHPDTWSPFPVLGYRMWVADDSGFSGVRRVWASSTMEATCLTTGDDDEVPHTDGRCGFPPCGVYAMKDARELLTERPPHTNGTVVVGLIGMSGKVVEHRRGYRAAKATVLALVLLGDTPAGIADPAEIDALFQDPSHPARSAPLVGAPTESAITFLEDQARRLTWTSEKKNG
jgi:hypothetical protein